MLDRLLENLGHLLDLERLLSFAQSLLLLVLGFVVARIAARALHRVAGDRLEPAQALLLRRVVYYTLLALFGAAALTHLGFDLGVLVGAAGILTVALGFASQTSASNLISGLFLIAERPFTIGDVIQVEDVSGFVLSIDLLSLKLRTFDNVLVRIPNEMLIKSRVRTLTRFPIRRADIPLSVAYKEDLKKVKRVLFEVADKNPLCLEEPKPLLILTGFGDSGIDVQFSVWAQRDLFLEVRNGVYEAIKEAFDREGIEIPFPHRSLYAGSATEPLPIQVVPALEPTPPRPS